MSLFQEKYNFLEREKYWQEFWRANKVYQWDKDTPRSQTYVIDTPPPTVSGQLHIGHVYSYTHTDIIARYQRMKGMNLFYPMGFDDNGLPTERLVEKKKKIKASHMPRQEFISICQAVISEEEERFKDLFDSIALSVDWNLKYRTIDALPTKISQMSFLDLVAKGQIYRNAQPILWDPVDQTALSQADIEDKEHQGFMNDINFTLKDGSNIKIATTRPELLPACVAIFYHPEDKRYAHLKGVNAITPLFSVQVPIIADENVDPEKGTGLVMCCTFGDQTDVLWWRKYNLPTKLIITKKGTIGEVQFDGECLDADKASANFAQIQGMKVVEARAKIIDMLKENGFLVEQHSRQQFIKCAERSGAPLEILMTPQWFVKAIDHKDVLLEKSRELKWYPQTMKIKLDSWINDVSLDWCISRQRFFGVPFPVWYSKRPGEEGKALFADIDQLPVDPLNDLPQNYTRDEIEPDMDVMDTWSTSSVSAQINSHGIANDFMIDPYRHNSLFPADLRPQAHEIIRTWAYYSMLKSYLHEASLPWRNIMISGWCLAEDRSKMSKSKGNIIDPENLLKQFGADIIRYWAASAKLGSDTAYSNEVMTNGKRLVNKLWNAAKFVSQHFDKISEEYKSKELVALKNHITGDIDKYFLSSLENLVQDVTNAFEKYEYADAIHYLERFFWDMFCDSYLEITKVRSYDEKNQDEVGAQSARISLYHGFKTLLKLFAPFVPHITEELYQALYSKGESVHSKGNWVQSSSIFTDTNNDNESKKLLTIIDLVRKEKSRRNLSIKAPIQVLKIEKEQLSPSLRQDLQNVVSAETISVVETLQAEDNEILSEGDIKIYMNM